MMVSDLKVGQFGKVNGSIVYRFETSNITAYPAMNGLLTIERHPEKTLNWLDLQICELIETPKLKHINNTKSQLKKMIEHKFLDNLSYVENLSILKNYLKPVIVSGD